MSNLPVEIRTNEVEANGKTFVEVSVLFNGVEIGRMDVSASNDLAEAIVSTKVGKKTHSIEFGYNPKVDAYIGNHVGNFIVGGKDLAPLFMQELDASDKAKTPTGVAKKKEKPSKPKAQGGQTRIKPRPVLKDKHKKGESMGDLAKGITT